MNESVQNKLEADHEDTISSLAAYACRDTEAVRPRQETFDVLEPPFVKDVQRILSCRIFNRYADKTQVFSLYRNDDITRRMQHVQIVSRIARSVGRLLKLNQDLIEAIALGHDIGHTPFGHAGERFLSHLLFKRTGHCFSHNVQSVRLLERILDLNLSVQTLDGILCHNGRSVRGTVYPDRLPADPHEMLHSFSDKFSNAVQTACERSRLVPSTLEGLVVRLADVLAYLGKDRQDAQLLGIGFEGPSADGTLLGRTNEEFIAEVVTNLVECSYGHPFLHLDQEFADAIANEKQLNYRAIYARQDSEPPYPQLEEMFERLYERCVRDLQSGNMDTPIYRHHISKFAKTAEDVASYLEDGADLVTVDFIASMTDDYFIDFYEELYPDAVHLEYRSYFSSARISMDNDD